MHSQVAKITENPERAGDLDPLLSWRVEKIVGNTITLRGPQLPAGYTIAGFFTGPSITAVRTRGGFKSAFGAIRGTGERAGISTGPVGTSVYHYRAALRIAAVAAAVLAAAGASMRWADLASVIGTRFGVDPRAVPATTPVDDLDGALIRAQPGLSSEPSVPGAELLRRATAQAVLDQRTDRERLVLAWLASPIRTIADRTGLAVSTAGLLKQRVTDRLRTMLADDPDAEATALACRDLAASELGIEL